MSKQFKAKEIPLTGKLVTSTDGITIGDNFKQLINLRYEDLGLSGVEGHTKINTNALAQTQVRSAIHFRKEQPAESHVVVQAFTGGATPKIYTNDTAIPGTGDFVTSPAQLYTEDTAASTGRFSEAPDGALVYCNQKETCVWGGDEFRVASFIRYDPDDTTKKWDYTEQVSNTLTTEYATLVKSGGATVDANTMLLLHLDETSGNPTDSSPTTPHTVTNNGSMAYDATNKKFGDRSADIDGTNDYLSLPDDADFDFSAGGTNGIFTFDFWISGPADQDGTIWHQQIDATNYLRIRWEYFGSHLSNHFGYIHLEVFDSGGTDQTVSSSQLSIKNDTSVFTHIAVVGDGSTYYIFVNGTLSVSAAIVTTPEDYYSGGGNAYIGCDEIAGAAPQNPLEMHIDEFRVSNVARWTGTFTPPDSAYPANAAEIYVGSIMPIQGINFTVETANTSACTPAVSYWDGSGWTNVGAVTDGTNGGTGALEQDGSMTFTSTATTAKVRAIDNMILFWYRLSLPDIDDTTTVSNVTVDVPFQPIQDLWDGELRTILSCLQWDNATQTYIDHTVGVFEDHFDSADSGTFASITTATTDLDTGVDYILIGSTERLSGLSIYLVSGQENQDAATMSISYWKGDDWVSVGTVTDGTLEDGTTLAKSGFVTWNSPSYGTEFKRQDLSMRRTRPQKKTEWRTDDEGELRSSTTLTLDGTKITSKEYKRLNNSIKKQPVILAQYEYSMYWYKMEFNATLTGTPYVQAYYIGGIPAQNEIGGYSYPVYHNESVWLISEPAQHKNAVAKSSTGTVNVFNGSGSADFRIGGEEEIIGGASIKAVMDRKMFPALVLFKKHETWVIYGSLGNYSTMKISPNIGCIAPGTIQNCSIKTEEGEVEVVLFQSVDGIYATNGASVFEVSQDISSVFDKRETVKIDTDYLDQSYAFYDSSANEYHWLWTSDGQTVHDKEYVFDTDRMKWFTIDRGTGADLQVGVEVRDTLGDSYTYGFIDTGFMMRLENRKTFITSASANNITYTMELGDLALADSITTETILRNVGIHSVGKTATANTVAVTHYGDTRDAASTNNDGSAITPLDAGDSGERAQIARRSVDIGPYTYHGLKFVITNSDDAVGFEPIYVYMLYDLVRQGIRG